MATMCADEFNYTHQLSLILIDEKEIKKHFARHTQSMKLTALKLKGQGKLTTLINGCLPPMYYVYKEISCSPRLVIPKGIPIRKGSRKIRLKRDS